MGSKRRLLTTAALALAALPATLGGALALPGPVDRPAIASGHASTAVLLAVARAGGRLVAVGERGVVVLSDDDGVTWRQAEVPVSVTLTAAAFPTPQQGWAVGHYGVVLHTDDGGETWAKQLDGVHAARLALDAARSRAKDGETEGGERLVDEAQLLVDDGPDKPFLDVFFEDERRGFVVGAYNLIFHTDDGGGTWQPWLHRVENPMGLHLYGIGSGNGRTYIAGEQGLFLRRSEPAGAFAAVPTPYPGSYFGLLAAPGGTVLVFGLRGNAFRSDDGGESWHKVETGVPVSVTAGTVLADGTLVLATQAGLVLASHDGGKRFTPIPLEVRSAFADVTEAADGSLVLVGARGATRVGPPRGTVKEANP